MPFKGYKRKTPCQGVCNKPQIDEVPSEPEALRKLESVLIAQRLVFQKIMVMPKGQQSNIKGVICNVPVNCETVYNSLPRPSEQSGVILLKYSGHQYCEAVRPEFLHRALEFLKENNELVKMWKSACRILKIIHYKVSTVMIVLKKKTKY